MSNLASSIKNFVELYTTKYDTCTVAYSLLDEHDDNITYPLLEIIIQNIKMLNLARITRTDYTLRFCFTIDEENKKETELGLDDLLDLKNTYFDMLYNWYFAEIQSVTYMGELSNVNVVRLGYKDKGETGSLDKNRIRIEIEFDISILEN